MNEKEKVGESKDGQVDKLTNWHRIAEKEFKKVGYYGLPDNKVCALDIEFHDGVRLLVHDDYRGKGTFEIMLRIDNCAIRDLRLVVGKSVTADKVEKIFCMLKSIVEAADETT